MKVYIDRRIQPSNEADNIINGQQDREMRRETSKMHERIIWNPYKHKLFISVDVFILELFLFLLQAPKKMTLFYSIKFQSDEHQQNLQAAKLFVRIRICVYGM